MAVVILSQTPAVGELWVGPVDGVDKAVCPRFVLFFIFSRNSSNSTWCIYTRVYWTMAICCAKYVATNRGHLRRLLYDNEGRMELTKLIGWAAIASVWHRNSRNKRNTISKKYQSVSSNHYNSWNACLTWQYHILVRPMSQENIKIKRVCRLSISSVNGSSTSLILLVMFSLKNLHARYHFNALNIGFNIIIRV